MEINIGHALKEIRLYAGYTIDQMAEKIDVKPVWLLNAEMGNKHISFTKFMRIVSTFGGVVEIKLPQRTIKADAIQPVPPYTADEVKTRQDERMKLNKERTDRWLKRMEKYVDEADGITDNMEQ